MTGDRPQSYNDWVRVIENNDPGVVAQIIVNAIEAAEASQADTISEWEVEAVEAYQRGNELPPVEETHPLPGGDNE